MVSENRDQVVNVLGPIGSGKTFNLVHTLEYLCFLYAPEKKKIEFFDVIHKSLQLVHIFGSIFRKNNLESNSCGMILKVGFDENNKICDFDLDSEFLDLTLPFSENGRSLSVLHSMMTGAATNIKRVLDLPEREKSLHFFRKFSQNFDKNTKERFQLNDYEIWNRLHSLLNFFEFSKNEVIEILQLLSFIMLCNEAQIGKKRSKFGEDYVLNKGPPAQRLAKNLKIEDDEFVKLFGNYKSLQEIKNSLITLMKYSYFCIFEGVKNIIKNYLNGFFDAYTNKKNSQSKNSSNNVNHSDAKKSKIKYLYFLDIPGDVEDKTLGGMVTNLANECQNLFAGGQYMSVVEKLSNEQLNMKYFQPLHSHAVIESLIGKDGLFGFLSHSFTEKNFKKFQLGVNRKEHFIKCLRFNDLSPNMTNYDMNFELKFSYKNVLYNYESLYLESKNVILTDRIIKIFESSKNSFIRNQIDYLRKTPKSIFGVVQKTLNCLFKPIKGLSPFVMYCLHSNNSLNIFFGKGELDKNKNFLKANPLMDNNFFNAEDWEIPIKQTHEILRNGLTLPILYWEWFGFHEWIDVELFINEFSDNFQKVQSSILMITNGILVKSSSNASINSTNNFKKINNLFRGSLSKFKDIPNAHADIKNLNPFEAANYMLSVLCAPKQYLIGSQHILFRKNVLNETREILKNIITLLENENLNKLLTKNLKYGRLFSSTNQTLSNRNSASMLGATSKAHIPPSSNSQLVNLSNKINTNFNVNANTDLDNSKNQQNLNMKQKNFKNINFSITHRKTKLNPNINFSRKIHTRDTSLDVSSSRISRSNSKAISGIDEMKRQNSFSRDNTNKINNMINNEIIEINLKENQGNDEVCQPQRKLSMKIQCHLEIIDISPELKVNSNSNDKNADAQIILEAKNDLGLNLSAEPKRVNFKIDDEFLNDKDDNNKKNNNNLNKNYNSLTDSSKYNLFNFLKTQKGYDALESSIMNSNTTYLEQEYEKYKRENNVIIPKKKYFNAFKNLFDMTVNDNYSIFDYSNNLNEIKLIQNSWRSHKSRMTYKVFRYCCRMIVVMQKFIRGWIIRRKFRKFRVVYKCITKIQKFYKRRHRIKVYYATKIQSLLRMKMARIYFLNKLARQELGEDSDQDINHNNNVRNPNDPNGQQNAELGYKSEYVYEEVEVTDSDEENNNEMLDKNFQNTETTLQEAIEDEKNLDTLNEDIKIYNNQENMSFSIDNHSVNANNNNTSLFTSPTHKSKSIRNSINNMNPSISKIFTEDNKNNISIINNNSNFSAITNSVNKTEKNMSNSNIEKMTNKVKAETRKNDHKAVLSNKKQNLTNVSTHNKNFENKNDNSKNKNVVGNNPVSKDKNKEANNNIKAGKTSPDKPKKKKKIVVKKRKLVPISNQQNFEKETTQKVLDRADRYAKIMIASGFTDKYLKSKKKHKFEKELNDVSVSNIERKKSLDQSSIINNKWYFNNLSLINELEMDKDKRQILDILMNTSLIKGIGKK